MRERNSHTGYARLAAVLLPMLILSGCSLLPNISNASSSTSASSDTPSADVSLSSALSSLPTVSGGSSSIVSSSSLPESGAPLTCGEFARLWVRQLEDGGTAEAQAVSEAGALPQGVDANKALTVQQAAYLLTWRQKSTRIDTSHYDWQLTDLSKADSGRRQALLQAYAQGLIMSKDGRINPRESVSRSVAEAMLERHADAKKRRLPPDCAAPYFEYQGLVEVKRLDPSIQLDLKYATTDNFTGVVHYSRVLCLLEADTAKRLVKANRYFQSRGYTIKIWDAYRPVAVQWELYNDTPAGLKQYAPAPSKNSQHCKGIAADITLVDQHGREMAMPTGFDSFSQKAHADYADLPKTVIANRTFLRSGMEKQGFVVYSLEWWHFYLPSKTGLTISKVGLDEFAGKRDAFYQAYIRDYEARQG